MEAYNFSHWPGGVENIPAFSTAPVAGSQAPDFTVTLLETGQPVQISDYWRESDLLIEFGSIT